MCGPAAFLGPIQPQLNPAIYNQPNAMSTLKLKPTYIPVNAYYKVLE